MRSGQTEQRQLQKPIVLGATSGLRLMAAAASGAGTFRDRVLSVTDSIQVMDVRAAIGKPSRSAADPALGEFANRPGWFVRRNLRVVAGKDLDTVSSDETFTTEDGVATHLVMVMMNVRVVAKPVSIKRLPKPDCKS